MFSIHYQICLTFPLYIVIGILNYNIKIKYCFMTQKFIDRCWRSLVPMIINYDNDSCIELER